ncbi:hypothetical protein Aperf_G00000091743 [Anoplocephala perfoliata]
MAAPTSSGLPTKSSQLNDNATTSGTIGMGILTHSSSKKTDDTVHRRHHPSMSGSLGTAKIKRDNSVRAPSANSKYSGKLSLQLKTMPNFGEGIDQKVLPLPPTRSTTADWFPRSPDRNCSPSINNEFSNTNSKNNENPPTTPSYRFGRLTSNFVKDSGQAASLSRIFLDAVERGDKSTVMRCLKCPHPVNVNCTNMLGRTAIQIAVDNENFEIVELLLKEPNIRIGDALLYAVQEGVYRIVEMLIDHHSITKEMLGTSWSKRISLSEESHDFSADISPVILASICNQFEILQLLLSRGARIERPHKSSCSCSDCVEMYKEDTLKYSLWRINTYRALASPAWISLTSPDPILAAFKLSWELVHLASRENEFKEVFLQLSDQCKKYACDLLDQCRSKDEVLAVLSRSSDDEDVYTSSEESSGDEEHKTGWSEGSALRRTTSVTPRHSRRWHAGPFQMGSLEMEDLVSAKKQLDRQYTIVEDLANVENHKEQQGNVKKSLPKERFDRSAEEDMEEVYDNEDADEKGSIFDDSESESDSPPLSLDRLKMAIKYEQKRSTQTDLSESEQCSTFGAVIESGRCFVAHPHCQHILTSLWYDQLPGWRKHHPILKLILCVGFVLALPFLALVYLVYPRGSVARILRSPIIKFVNHSASIAIFLILLLIASTDGQSVKALESRQMTRGPDPNNIELLIAWWVFGFVWSEMKQIWEEGFKAYIRQWWNWLDFIMLTLFLTTVGLRVVGLILRKTERYGFELAGREHWPADDPTLLAEACFAMAHIFSFVRILFLFQVNEHLGPLQISLGNMLIDITKFLFLFLLVITSFACGLHQLYYYYFSIDNDMRPGAFSSLLKSYQALFWHLFGVTQINQYRMHIKDAEGNLVDLKSAEVTMTVGEMLLMIYHAMAIIVLVNMLIAMMSNSFQTIQNQADVEWKFARSKLWLGYFDEGSTLPPPLNTIVSPKSLWRFVRGLFRLLICSSHSQPDDHPKKPRFERYRRHRRSTVKPCPSPSQNQQSMSVRASTKTSGRGSGIMWTDHPGEPAIRLPSSVNNADRTERPETVANQGDEHSSKRSRKKNSYQAITRILVRRYIHVSKKTMRQGVVNEDDLLEIKQDISSLRYELREDRQREVVRSISHLEGLKYQLLSVLAPHHKPVADFAGDRAHPYLETQNVARTPAPSSKPPQPPPRFLDPGGVSPISEMKSLQAQIQSLREEIHRIPKTINEGPSTNDSQSSDAIAKASVLMNSTEGLQSFKNEIIEEVKNELHSFARQLMQFMNQHQRQVESSSGLSSETRTASVPQGGPPVHHSAISRAPDIDRTRIGGVSVTYAAGDSTKLSLTPPRQTQSRHQNR